MVSALAPPQRLPLHMLLLGSHEFISVNCPRLEPDVVVTGMHVSALCQAVWAAFTTGVLGQTGASWRHVGMLRSRWLIGRAPHAPFTCGSGSARLPTLTQALQRLGTSWACELFGLPVCL